MRCPRCSESPSALEFVGHVERVHFGHGAVRWACQHCHYQSASFHDAIAHCLVLHHDPQNLRMIPPDEIVAIASRAYRSQNDPILSTITQNSPLAHSTRIARQSEVLNVATHHIQENVYKPRSPSPNYDNLRFDLAKNRSPRRSRKRSRKSFTSEPQSPLALYSSPHYTEGSHNHNTTAERPICEQPSEEEDPWTGSETEEGPDIQPPAIAEPIDRSTPTAISCQHCGIDLAVTATNKAATVIRHVLACIKLRPFACTLCDYSVAQKSKMKNHFERHHPEIPSASRTFSVPNKFCFAFQ